MQRLGTDEISQYTSVHQYQVEGHITWDPLPPSLPTDPPPPLRPATGDETDSSHISAQLDGVFIITTQQGSDRGRKQQRERWWSGGSNGGGEELGWQEGMKEGGGQEGGRMNRKKRGELGAVRCRGRGLCRGCQGVCLCFFLHACMHVFISVCVT